MKTTKTKIILIIALIISSVITFYYFPTIGLYFTCLSTATIIWQLLKLKKSVKLIIALITSILSWLLLVDKAFIAQGNKITNEIINYYNHYHLAPLNLNENTSLWLNSYTPIFTKYNYNNNYDSLRFYFCKISYIDVWGNMYEYCNKEGEFELREKPPYP